MARFTCPSGHVVVYDDDVVLPGRLSVGSHGYAQFWNGKTCVLFHRWLLGLVKGDGKVADHRNRDVMDCRRANLRAVTPSESNMNRSIALRSLPLGVYQTRSGRYQARIQRGTIKRYLGTHDTIEAASAAVRAA